MKKAILFSLFAVVGFGLSNKAVAQCSPDTTIKVPGFYPATFPEADQDKPYSATTTILSIKDTVVFGQAVIIDSTVLKAVLGLPPGINHQCQKNSCVFFPSKPSCVNFSGTPTQAGTYPLKMVIMIYAKIGGALPYNRVDTIRNFTMKVNGMNGMAIQEINREFTITPNPTSDQLHVYLGQQKNTMGICIMDAMGRMVKLGVERKDESHFVVDTHSLPAGVYFCSYGSVTKRFVKL